MAELHEIVVYIHGVSQNLRGRSHGEEYRALQDGIAARNPDWPSRYLGVEWGWNHTPGAAKGHEQLTDAQRQLGARTLPAVTAPGDFTLNPGRMAVNSLRPLLIYGFGDMFYYVSRDGKRSVRNAVAKQISEFVEQECVAGDAISLTLLGHSAGSVVALDFAFFLFFDGEGGEHEYVPTNDPAYAGVRRLRDMAEARTLRIRRLITFGSPITMLACRSDPVLKLLASGKELDPKDYGLTRNVEGGNRLRGPRWINLWDRDDPIAWPVEPLMKQGSGPQRVKDMYVDVSDSISRSHNSYWDSSLVHKTIAERW